ncbi:hypothetical protein RCL_jg319.t1 [Rhizophagus clarus]|uniref:Uncharacterized protein n=1 Tax=Rhizophagus clarus TaxID=94130 RepID=A0A8H3M3J5_9GLOM|nr:hypothetical protein RCL_jg319.t1 [Rhizophagus clarus]
MKSIINNEISLLFHERLRKTPYTSISWDASMKYFSYSPTSIISNLRSIFIEFKFTTINNHSYFQTFIFYFEVLKEIRYHVLGRKNKPILNKIILRN